MEGHFVDKIVKFNGQTSGRDKLFRLVQYCSKLIWWHLHKANLAQDLVQKLKQLSSALSVCRKFLRVGKSLDFIHAALQSIHISDNVIRWTITISKLNQAVYLLFDHIVLAGRIGIAKVDGKKWNELSAKFWLVTLVLGIVRDLYDLSNSITRELRARDAELQRQRHKLKLESSSSISGGVVDSSAGDGGDNNSSINGIHRDHDYHRHHHLQQHRHGVKAAVASRWAVVGRCLWENRPLVLDTVKNCTDLVLPLEALGKVEVSPGVQGLAGVVSSIIGITTTWYPLLRLVPS